LFEHSAPDNAPWYFVSCRGITRTNNNSVENIITAVLAAGFSKTSLANLKSAAAAFSSEAGVCHCLIFVLGVLFSNYFFN
jgi:hypothetical protein